MGIHSPMEAPRPGPGILPDQGLERHPVGSGDTSKARGGGAKRKADGVEQSHDEKTPKNGFSLGIICRFEQLLLCNCGAIGSSKAWYRVGRVQAK